MGRIYGAIFLVFCLVFAVGRCAAGSPQDYKDYAATQELRYNLEAGLVQSICGVESHWKHPTARGYHGEYGLCQIKPDTVRMFCPSCASASQWLAQGSRGERVKLLQKQLKLRTIDGIFGLKTHQAVVEFQLINRLTPDGVVGPRTWLELFGVEMMRGSIATQLEDPHKNIEYAARYLAWLKEYLETDDRDILAAAYNGGPSNPTVVYMLKVRRQ